MPRPDGRIEPGQPLRGAISARAWNRAQDAADIVLGANAGTQGGAPGSPVLKPYTWVYCKPSVTVARWGVLAITGVAITPTGSSGGATASFEEMPVLTANTPDATAKPWCVAVEPIESGKIGKVAVSGVVQLKQSDLGKAAGAEVLWKDSTWALIRISSGIKRGTFTGEWAKDDTTTVTDAVETSVTYSDVKNYLTSVTGTGTKRCLIAYVGSEWVLVQFDLLELDGYSAGKSQVLGTESGALKWIDTTDCETTTP
jgi:predicted RecA/RadA family phage recombinase